MVLEGRGRVGWAPPFPGDPPRSMGAVQEENPVPGSGMHQVKGPELLNIS